jgi:hypothetical protein
MSRIESCGFVIRKELGDKNRKSMLSQPGNLGTHVLAVGVERARNL